jgi:hypothetical protein
VTVVAGRIWTVVAARVAAGFAAAELASELVAAVATMQEPTVTSARVAACCAVIVVAAVKVTAVCVSVLWTWIVEPSTSAILPDTPGFLGVWLLLLDGPLLGLLFVAAVDEPPQAASVSATTAPTPEARTERVTRCRRAVAGAWGRAELVIALSCLSFTRTHSLRSASMGARRAARVAG